jgi:2-dehydro-3-deoxygluconokinase
MSGDDFGRREILAGLGAGDAFAAGVLHALRLGEGIDKAAADGLALTALKQSLPGDASLFGRAELDRFVAGGVDVRR